jgi:hypothetical protein
MTLSVPQEMHAPTKASLERIPLTFSVTKFREVTDFSKYPIMSGLSLRT